LDRSDRRNVGVAAERDPRLATDSLEPPASRRWHSRRRRWKILMLPAAERQRHRMRGSPWLHRVRTAMARDTRVTANRRRAARLAFATFVRTTLERPVTISLLLGLPTMRPERRPPLLHSTVREDRRSGMSGRIRLSLDQGDADRRSAHCPAMETHRGFAFHVKPAGRWYHVARHPSTSGVPYASNGLTTKEGRTSWATPARRLNEPGTRCPSARILESGSQSTFGAVPHWPRAEPQLFSSAGRTRAPGLGGRCGALASEQVTVQTVIEASQPRRWCPHGLLCEPVVPTRDRASSPAQRPCPRSPMPPSRPAVRRCSTRTHDRPATANAAPAPCFQTRLGDSTQVLDRRACRLP
jgi:hypothetical protein